MSASETPPSPRWKLSSLTNWLLYVTVGARVNLIHSRHLLGTAIRAVDSSPQHKLHSQSEQELAGIIQQTIRCEAELLQLSRLITQHNANKLLRHSKNAESVSEI